MDNRSAVLLEFDKIINILLGYCISEEGKRKLQSQQLFYKPEPLGLFHDMLAQLRMLLESDEVFPVVNFPEIEHLLPVFKKEGSSLDGIELFNISQFINSALIVKDYVQKTKLTGINIIIEYVEKIPGLQKLASEILKVITSSGQIRDDHPELKNLRKGLGDLNNKISILSSSYIADNRNLFQTDVPSQKDGRIVLPLKSNFKGKVKGIIHDISARGNILYIEPFDILELNNKIAVQEHEISIIANRIYREFTEKVRLEIENISLLIDSFSFFDTLIARAKFSNIYNCYRPEISESEIKLEQARHMLLGNKAVPITIYMNEGVQILIITGPNAGGKTVSVKTVGLLAMMNQFGLQIPAAEGSRLPVFDGIYADIGDDQSIEESLSTFSGHMTNIASILDKCSSRTLVLLDELGSGTDPGEGAAIAMAVLDNLIEKGSIVLTTSHHGLLKNYGYTRERVMNASMEFDEGTHTSTYHVVLGVPGDSHAVDIAKHSGIPGNIIVEAQTYLKDKQTQVGRMIGELEKKHKLAGKREDAISQREKILRNQIRVNDLKELSFKQSENELKRKRNNESSKFLSAARKTLENLVKELKEGEITQEKTKKVKKFLLETDEKIDQEKETLNKFIINNPDRIKTDKLEPGVDVLIGEYRRPGTVVRKGKKEDWIINTGALKISVNINEIFPAPSEKKQEPFGISLSKVKASNTAKFSLDLRGFRLETALASIEKQIDNALMSGLSEFHIIHGKGEGVLSNGVQNFLKNEYSVKDFYFAHPDDGGFGKTIVILKE
ncbi:MAG: endonuclease MutS2 [Spirochaetales bacterium]|nr:endonuclease MutS2 [Spirochaetales bacterium]